MKERELPVTSKVTFGFLQMRDQYLSNAEETIKKGEFRKASELLWGAITQMIKSVASLSNISIRKHAEFFHFIETLGKQTKDENIYPLFLDLNSLHRNFYDEIIPERDFIIFYKKACFFMEKLSKFVETPKMKI
jgi:hypothetical protein